MTHAVGVFRESGSGHRVAFDEVLGRGQRVSPGTGVEVRRRYRAAHNIGHFRFVEFVGGSGALEGTVVPCGELLVPFDPSLQDGRSLGAVAIERRPGPEVMETYRVDRHGLASVEITDVDTGYAVSLELGARGERHTAVRA